MRKNGFKIIIVTITIIKKIGAGEMVYWMKHREGKRKGRDFNFPFLM
jgi:hypothetical protein